MCSIKKIFYSVITIFLFVFSQLHTSSDTEKVIGGTVALGLTGYAIHRRLNRNKDKETAKKSEKLIKKMNSDKYRNKEYQKKLEDEWNAGEPERAKAIAKTKRLKEIQQEWDNEKAAKQKAAADKKVQEEKQIRIERADGFKRKTKIQDERDAQQRKSRKEAKAKEKENSKQNNEKTDLKNKESSVESKPETQKTNSKISPENQELQKIEAESGALDQKSISTESSAKNIVISEESNDPQDTSEQHEGEPADVN